jgi:putative monooxygenase
MPLIKPHQKANLPEWSGLSDYGMYTMQPGESGDRHYHDFDEAWFIVAGRATVGYDDEDLEVSAGDALFTPMGVEHQIKQVHEPLTVVFTSGPLLGRNRPGHLHRDENGS